MHKSLLKIELISDLCVADGNGYNSSVDIDVCQDAHGLPCIPAKRLKGCLRECAQELNDWGEEIPVTALFGEEGDRKGACSIRNAYLENRDDCLKEILASGNYALCHPQNILRNFTYIRSQTSIDHDSGTAETNSLRSVRVVKKGLVFVADVEWNSEKDFDSYEQSLRNCCTVLKHMGMSRTRGFGSVRVSLENRKNDKTQGGHEHYMEGATRLTYEIMLKEPVICKSVNGQEQNSLDYIEGAKVLGLIAGGLKKAGHDFAGFMREDGAGLKCSNAYLQKDGVRLNEVPASCFGIKNNSSDYCDKIYMDNKRESDDRDRQLNQMKHCYVNISPDGLLKKYNVAMEERYHHRRPGDKSIGRADDSEDSVFYQISSISAGQKFQGFVTGSAGQIRQVYDILTAEDEVQLGYGKTSEYGRCGIRVVSTDIQPENKIEGREFWLLLAAHAVLYNDRAFYTTDIEDLKEEVMAALGIEKSQVEWMRCYVNLTTLGGYNVTWQMRKPTVDAFDKGTVVHFKLKNEMKLPVHTSWIGERNAEGYGEISIHKVKDNGPYLLEKKIWKNNGGMKQTPLCLEERPFLTEVAGKLFQDFMEYRAACDVAKEGKNLSEEIRPTIQDMLLMCQTIETVDGIKTAVKKRFEKASEHKQKKKEAAEGILKKVCASSETLEKEFREQQNLEKFSYTGDVKMEYLKHYLLQMKYKLRNKEVEGKNEQSK